MNVDDMTIGEAKKLMALLGGASAMPDHAYPVGQKVFVRTVTMHYTGLLVRVTAGELVLEDAAWVADSGRFHVALAKGTLNEVEPYPKGQVVVPRGGVIDVSTWSHDLPRDPK